MKSAFELALERSGGDLQPVSEEKKAKINEIDQLCKAKLAEAELSGQQRLAALSDPEEIDKCKEELAHDLQSIRSRYEYQKEQIRNS